MVRSLFYVLILLLLYFIIQFIFFPNPPKLLAKIPPVIQSILTTLHVKSPHIVIQTKFWYILGSPNPPKGKPIETPTHPHLFTSSVFSCDWSGN